MHDHTSSHLFDANPYQPPFLAWPLDESRQSGAFPCHLGGETAGCHMISGAGLCWQHGRQQQQQQQQHSATLNVSTSIASWTQQNQLHLNPDKTTAPSSPQSRMLTLNINVVIPTVKNPKILGLTAHLQFTT